MAFDSAGRITVITPPLAARLGLVAPAWPVSGDFLDARLYQLGDSTVSYVIVVRRQRDEVDRFPLEVGRRADLAAAIARATMLARVTSQPDSLPTSARSLRGTHSARSLATDSSSAHSITPNRTRAFWRSAPLPAR